MKSHLFIFKSAYELSQLNSASTQYVYNLLGIVRKVNTDIQIELYLEP